MKYRSIRKNVAIFYSNDAMLSHISYNANVGINNVSEDSLINSKKEWNYVHISLIYM